MNKKESSDNKKKDEFEILQVFGIKLKVKDAKIADLLTTDVKTDISTFRQKMEDSQVEEKANGERTIATEQVESLQEFESVVNRIGKKLEFDISLGEVWRSSTGIAVLLRPVFDSISFEIAKAKVDELARKQAKIKTENVGLFVTRNKQSCDILKAAIRSKNMYQQMRVVSYENLFELLDLKETGYLKHRQVVTLMVPLDNVDVGELLNIIKAVAIPTSLQDYLGRKKS